MLGLIQFQILYLWLKTETLDPTDILRWLKREKVESSKWASR